MIFTRHWVVSFVSDSSFRFYSRQLVKNLITRMDLMPKDVRGMTKLDRSKFFKEVTVPSVQVPNQNVALAMKIFKRYLLRLWKVRPVVDAKDEDRRKVLLDPLLFPGQDCLTEEERTSLSKLKISDSDFIPHNLRLEYENYKEDEIFKAVLPEGKEGCSSYSRIGHIIHLNLKEHLLPYKHLIGEVMVDKLVGVKTVVNKSQAIDSTYRNFQMELLAGEADFVATVKENHCIFKFDFSAVYWNSRLCSEHERILKLLPEKAVLFDVFAGVGPFAVPAAKVRRCRVFANDLNPSSHHWLNENARQNKVIDKVQTFNLDGREFIRKEFGKFLQDQPEHSIPVHVTMNLPALAVDFLDAFIGLVDASEDLPQTRPEVTIHVYSFCCNSSATEEMMEKVNSALSYKLGESDVVELVDVRDVAPNKHMIRLSFNLPDAVLYSSISLPKRIKLGDDAPTSPQHNEKLNK